MKEQFSKLQEGTETQGMKQSVGTTRKDLPKGKRVHSLSKHMPEMSKRFKELRLKAEEQEQKPPQQDMGGQKELFDEK